MNEIISYDLTFQEQSVLCSRPPHARSLVIFDNRNKKFKVCICISAYECILYGNVQYLNRFFKMEVMSEIDLLPWPHNPEPNENV